MLAVIALVAFIYCGGSRVPRVLNQNKDMILGVLGGLVLCSFFGMRLEGISMLDKIEEAEKDALKSFQNKVASIVAEARKPLIRDSNKKPPPKPKTKVAAKVAPKVAPMVN